MGYSCIWSIEIASKTINIRCNVYIYGYDAGSESEVDFKKSEAIAVMAVDNLPCELPRDASEGFAKTFIEKIIPAFFNDDKE